jgi:hypothetical protein
MSQPPSDMRKFVFVFTGPAVDERGIPYDDTMSTLTKLGKLFGWQAVESHCVPLDAPIRVGDVAPSQSDKTS